MNPSTTRDFYLGRTRAPNGSDRPTSIAALTTDSTRPSGPGPRAGSSILIDFFLHAAEIGGHHVAEHGTAEDEAGTAEPRSAAEDFATAESLSARARAMRPTLSSHAAEQHEYRRYLDWRRMHLRLAEAITAGAALVVAHRQLLANAVRPHNTYVSYETQKWAEFLGNHHPTRRSA